MDEVREVEGVVEEVEDEAVTAAHEAVAAIVAETGIGMTQEIATEVADAVAMSMMIAAVTEMIAEVEIVEGKFYILILSTWLPNSIKI